MKRVLLCILAVLVLAVGGGAFYVTHMDTGFIARRIAEATKSATGAPLELESAPRISLLPPGISFGAARWNGTAAGHAMSFSLASGMVRLELAPLFSGNIIISELRLDRPEADIRLAAPAGGKEGSAPPGTAGTLQRERKAPDDALPFELGRLTMSQGALHLEDGRRDIRVSGFNLSLENLRRREDMSLQGDLVLDLGERPAGALSPEAAKPATLLRGNLAFKGTLRYYAPNLTFRQVSVGFTPLGGFVPRELSPLQLTGEGALDLASLRLSLPMARLTVPQGQLKLSGEGGLQPPAFAGDLTFTGSAAALTALGGATLPRELPDAVALRSRVDWAGGKLGLDGRLGLGAAPEDKPVAELAFKGNGSLEPAAFAGDLALTGSARRLAALAGATLPADAPDSLDARSRVDFADFFVRLAPLNVRAAGLTLDGTLGIRLPRAAETDPTYDANLRMGPVVLDPWLEALKAAPGQEGAAAARQAPEGGKTEPAPGPGGKSPVPRLPSLDLRLTVDQLRYRGFSLNKVSTRLVCFGSEVNVAPFSATLATGGQLKLSGKADLAKSSFLVSASGLDLNIAGLCSAAGTPGLAVGTASLTTRLEATGADSKSLLASLTGNGVLMGSDLSTPALRDIDGKLRALPIKVRIPDRLETLQAPFTISRGELTAGSITGGSPGISLTARLQASLVRQYLEGTALLTGLPVPVPLSFKGPFNDIAVSLDPKAGIGLDTDVFSGKVPGAMQLPGGGTGSRSAVPDRARQARDVVRGLLGR